MFTIPCSLWLESLLICWWVQLFASHQLVDCYVVFVPVSGALFESEQCCTLPYLFTHNYWRWLEFMHCTQQDFSMFMYALTLLASIMSDCLQLPLLCKWDFLPLWNHKLLERSNHEHIGYLCGMSDAVGVWLIPALMAQITKFCLTVSQCWCQYPFISLAVLNWIVAILRCSEAKHDALSVLHLKHYRLSNLEFNVMDDMICTFSSPWVFLIAQISPNFP